VPRKRSNSLYLKEESYYFLSNYYNKSIIGGILETLSRGLMARDPSEAG
jgi:hypothetical protein